MFRSTKSLWMQLCELFLMTTIVSGMAQSQTSGGCNFTMYDPPPGYIYDLSPGGINHWNTVVGGVGGPNQGMEKGYIRWSGGGFTLFAVPNHALTFFTDRNLYGTTVGWYGSGTSVPPPGIGSPTSGFIYTSKSWATLNYPGSPSTALKGINKLNTIIGNAVSPQTKATFGFKYQNGTFIKIQYPAATQTQVTGINDNGVIVGGYQMGNSTSPWYGYILANGKFTKLNYLPAGILPTGINNAGDIVSYNEIHYPNGTNKSVYPPGSPASSSVSGINDLGVITGVAYWGTFEYKGFTATCN